MTREAPPQTVEWKTIYCLARLGATCVVDLSMNGYGEAMDRVGAVSTAPVIGAPRLVLALLTIICVGAGWLVRDREYLSPEYGIGQALGIAGGVMMLALLLYSARKRLRFMRSWGPLKSWFALHQALGVVGPVCVLFHANFGFGSMNSRVALICMLTIVASGLVGRFLHGKIHHGLHERRAWLGKLRYDLETARGATGSVVACYPRVSRRLAAVEARLSESNRGGLPALWLTMLLGLRQRWDYLLALWDLKKDEDSDDPSNRRERALEGRRVAFAKTLVWAYLTAARNVAEFTLYERLFATWHALHVPLFFMLLMAGVVHVVVVHGY